MARFERDSNMWFSAPVENPFADDIKASRHEEREMLTSTHMDIDLSGCEVIHMGSTQQQRRRQWRDNDDGGMEEGGPVRRRRKKDAPKPQYERVNDPDDANWLRNLRRQRPKRDWITESSAVTALNDLARRFRRPSPPTTAPPLLQLYIVDINYLVEQGTPWIRMIFLTPEGCSAALYVRGFAPYFYARVTPKLAELIRNKGETEALRIFQEWLEKRVGYRRKNKDHDDAAAAAAENINCIARVTLETNKWRSIFSYERDTSAFLRIETTLPKYVPLARDVLFQKEPRIVNDDAAAAAPEDADDDAANDGAVVDEDDDAHEGASSRATDHVSKTALEKHLEQDAAYGRFEVFEADTAYVVRYMIDQRLVGCGWVQVKDTQKLEAAPAGAQRRTRCALEYTCTYTDIEALPKKSDVPPVRGAAIDIECAGRDGRFPKPDQDPIICISINIYRLQDGVKPLCSVGFAVGDVAQPPASSTRFTRILRFGASQPLTDYDHWNTEAEIDMLLAVRQFLLDMDPDFYIGYNSDGFDTPYMFKRADALGIGSLFRDISRVRGEVCSLQSSTFSSRAYGTRTDLNLNCPGRISWDVVRIVRRDLKLRSYTLNFVAGRILGRKKHEVSHDQIGPSWIGPKATPQSRLRVLEYNENDERLTAEINIKQLYIYQFQELARVTGVPIDFILRRGQGVKSMSQILRSAREAGYLAPTFSDFKEKCLRSGFPECLRSANGDTVDTRYLLPPSSSMFDHPTLKRLRPQLGDVFIFVSVRQDLEKNLTVVARKDCAWASIAANHGVFLRTFRETQRKNARTILIFTVYKTRKLYAIGHMTSERCVAGSNKGAQWTGNKYEAAFDVDWIVFFEQDYRPDLPQELADINDGTILNLDRAKSCLALAAGRVAPDLLAARYGAGKGKTKKKKKENSDGDVLETADDNDEEQSTYQGAIVLRLILGFYRVPVATLDFQSLYPSIMIRYNLDYTTYITEAECKRLGLREAPKTIRRFSDGSEIIEYVYEKRKRADDSEYYDYPEGSDYIITPAGHRFVTPQVRRGLLPELLQVLLNLRAVAKTFLGACKKCRIAASAATRTFAKPDASCSVADAFATDFKLKPTDKDSVNVKKLLESFEEQIKKLAPEELDMLVEIKSTWASMNNAPTQDRQRIVQLCDTLCNLLCNLESVLDGRQNALKISANSLYGFTGASVCNLPLKAIAESVTAFGRQAIEKKKRLVELEFPLPEKYTGPKKMRPVVLGGDTDSIFIVWPNCLTVPEAFELSKQAEKWVNQHFQPPMKTTFEKVYWPALYIAPKRYAGRKYTKPEEPDQVPKPDGKPGETMDLIEAKGIESVRRDNCALVVELVENTLRYIFEDGAKADKTLGATGPERAIAYVAGIIEDLRMGRVDLSKLVISKSLSKEPEKYATQTAHTRLATLLKQRSPETAPRVGDRVPYIIVAPPPSNDIKMADCGEDPGWVLEHGTPLYVDYYLKNMLRKPAERLLEVMQPGIIARLFDNVPLRSKKLHDGNLVGFLSPVNQHISTPSSVSSSSSSDDKDKDKKKNVADRSEYAASQLTLDWARSVSVIHMENIELTIRRVVARRRGVSMAETSQIVRVNNVATDSPLLASEVVKIADTCFRCKREVTKALGKATRGQCIDCGPNAVCDCEASQVAPALCNRCLRTQITEARQLRERARQDVLRACEENDDTWQTCIECTGSFESAEPCVYKECSNWFPRARTRKQLADARAQFRRFSVLTM